MPSLSVCLLLDRPADEAVRRLWRRLEDDGVPTLASHTHGRHVPHITLAHLGAAEPEDVQARLVDVRADPVRVRLTALGAFTRTRCALIPTVPPQLLAAHASTVAALEGAGLTVAVAYRPGGWLPHLTLGPRLPVAALPQVARRVYDVLPLPATLGRLAVVDTTTGTVRPV